MTTLLLAFALSPRVSAAQDGETPAATLKGTIVFDGEHPKNLHNASGATLHWRIPSNAAYSNPHLPLEQMMVVLVQNDSNATAPSPEEADFKVGGYRVEPYTWAVSPGSTLKFTNAGPGFYTLKAVGRAGIKDVKLNEEANSGTAELKKSGRYIFQDLNLPSAIVYVVVINKVAASALKIQETNKAGFDLGNPPPGSYSLQTFLRGKLVDARDIQVTAGDMPKVEFLLTQEDLLKALD